MSIDPQVSMILNIVMAVVGALAAMSPSMFPSYLPQGTVSEVIQTCGFVTTLYGAINAGLHGFSAPAAGPMVEVKK